MGGPRCIQSLLQPGALAWLLSIPLLTPAANIRCWGSDLANQSRVPSDLPLVVGMSAGEEHMCAVTKDKNVLCWGSNDKNQLEMPAPTSGVAEVHCGAHHSCLRYEATRTVACWGRNNRMQLEVPGDLTAVVGLDAGHSHNCAWTEAGAVVCWGGVGDGWGAADVPANLPPVVSLSTGYRNTCALTRQANLVCWGTNSTEIGGLGTLQGVTFYSTGFRHACAVSQASSGDEGVCFGLHATHGQLQFPNDVAAVVGIAAGKSSTCLWTEAGQVACWGKCDVGQCLPPSDMGHVLHVVAAKGYGGESYWESQYYCALLEVNETTTSTGTKGVSSTTLTTASTSTTTSDLAATTAATTTTNALTTTALAAKSTITSASTTTFVASTSLPDAAATIAWTTNGATSTVLSTAQGMSSAVSTTASATSTTSVPSLTTTMELTSTAPSSSMTTNVASLSAIATSTTKALPSTTATTTVVVHDAASSPLPIASATAVSSLAMTPTAEPGTSPSSSSTPETSLFSPKTSVLSSATTTATVVSAASRTATTSAVATLTTAEQGQMTVSTSLAVTTPISSTLSGLPPSVSTAASTSAVPISTKGEDVFLSIDIAKVATATSALVPTTPTSSSSLNANSSNLTEASLNVPRPQVTDPVSLEELVADLEPIVLSKALENGEAAVEVANVKMFAVELLATTDASYMEVTCVKVMVEIPRSLLATAKLDRAVLIVSSIAEPQEVAQEPLWGVDSKGDRVIATGIQSIKLFDPAGRRVLVKDSPEPIFFTLPVVPTDSTRCAFWDESQAFWSQEGVTTIRTESGSAAERAYLRCATTHFTSFAGIAKGFGDTITCMNVRLISAEGIAALGNPGWYHEPIAVTYIVLLAVFAMMFLVAAAVDARRLRSGAWNDEYFLLSRQSLMRSQQLRAQFMRQGTRLSSDSEQGEHVLSPQSILSPKMMSPRMMSPLASPVASLALEKAFRRRSLSSEEAPVWSIASLRQTKSMSSMSLGDPVSWKGSLTSAAVSTQAAQGTRGAKKCCSRCGRSSALRDALDDVVARWFVYFSEVRDFVESLWDGLDVEDGNPEEGGTNHSYASRLSHALLGSALSSAAKRQAAAASGVSLTEVKFIIEDAALKEVLLEAAIGQNEEGETDDLMQRWLALHEALISHIDEYWGAPADWRSIPASAQRLFITSSPFVSVFLSCNFWTSSLRVLWWACELLGSLMVATVFFQASGMSGKRSRGECAPLFDPMHQVGRLLAIGVFALIVAYIPVGLMFSLHSRSLKVFGEARDEEWMRQLRIWRIQDRLLWFLGLIYVFCCAAFLAIFLANVAPASMAAWAVTGGISVLEDTLVIPIGIGLFVPFTSACLLSLVSFARNAKKEDLLQQRRQMKEACGGSWYKIIDSI